MRGAHTFSYLDPCVAVLMSGACAAGLLERAPDPSDAQLVNLVEKLPLLLKGSHVLLQPVTLRLSRKKGGGLELIRKIIQ